MKTASTTIIECKDDHKNVKCRSVVSWMSEKKYINCFQNYDYRTSKKIHQNKYAILSSLFSYI